jgi:hypothetical protein
MVYATNQCDFNTYCQVERENCIAMKTSIVLRFIFLIVTSMCSDEKLLQFLMSKDFTARYAADDDQYEEDRYLQERHQNLPPKSLIEQMVSVSMFDIDCL